MTIQSELQELGPDVVRRAMVAFEHRGDRRLWEWNHPCPSGEWETDCCFLRHAFAREPEEQFQKYLEWRQRHSEIEEAFEFGDREALRRECVVYLAEHEAVPV